MPLTCIKEDNPFIDEIHRFNKGQQDVLLPYVEDGTVILIGATTENPYFEVNRPLLSRLRVVRLKRLSQEALISILKRALANRSKGLGYLSLHADDDILGLIAQGADSDARVALNLLEQVSLQLPEGGTVTEEIVRKPVANDYINTIKRRWTLRYGLCLHQEYARL